MFYSKQITPLRFSDLVPRLLLFSLLSFMLSLSPKPARAQIPGSGGLGSGGSGLPGPGYPSGPSWHITISSTGNVTANPPTGTQTAAWNTPAETVVSSQTITQGQTVTITTTGQYTIVLQWLNGDGSSPPTTGYGSPPKNVLLDTISATVWNGPYISSSGSASNGLGSPVQKGSLGPMQWETDDGELYTLQNGSSGTIIYVVQVNTTVTATNVLYATATASVSRGPINASCNSIVINLMGMTVDPNQNNIDSILISHQCMASVFIMTPFTSIVNLKWTVNGDTFDSFFISADQTIGHVVYCNPTNWSSSYPQWCWWDTGGASETGSADSALLSGAGAQAFRTHSGSADRNGECGAVGGRHVPGGDDGEGA